MVPNFPSLTTLKIREISGLVGLREAFVEALVALEDLKIESCCELKYLWQDGVDLAKLANLKRLKIDECKQLVSLVEGGKGTLPYALEVLLIQECPSLKSFPRGKLPTTLKELRIAGCEELESEYWLLEGIMQCDAPPLEVLSVWSFSISSFPTGKFPTSLKTLQFHYCKRIQSLPSLLNLSHLTQLIISCCDELESFTDQELPLPNLTSLGINFCKKLRSLHNHMDSLQQLTIRCCHSLVSFPDQELPLPNLISLKVFSCEKLRSLSNHMDSLQRLEIRTCSSLVSFPETGLPPKLTLLSVKNCKNLRQPISEWRLHTLMSLQRLEIGFESPYTTDVDYFPDDDGLLLPTSLTSLAIQDHKKLKSISSGIQHLTSLEELQFSCCPELHVLPKEGLPATLGYLSFFECPLLEERCLKEEGDYRPVIAHIPLVTDE